MNHKPVNTAVTVEAILDGLWQAVVPQRLENIAALSNEAIKDLELESLIAKYGDFTKRICFKTGLLLEQRSIDLTRQAIEHHTRAIKAKYRAHNDEITPEELEDKVISFIQRDCTRDCAIHWLYTDSHNLDYLIESDPISYAVFSIGFIMANHSPMADYSVAEHKRIKDYGERCDYYADYKRAEFEWTWQKYILREQLKAYPIEQIVRINEQMRHYLTCYDARNIDTFDRYDELLGEGDIYILPMVGQKLEQFTAIMTNTNLAIIAHLERKRILIPERDYDRQLKLSQMYGGYSNFRNQFKPKGLTDTDVMWNGLYMGSEAENIAIKKTTQYGNRLHATGQIEVIDPHKPKGFVAKKGVTLGSFKIKPKQ